MQLSLLTTASLLQLGALRAFAHNADDIPVPQVFGGRNAMRHLPRQVVEEIQSFSARHLRKRDWSEPDVETDDPDHQRCGPGLGFCAPGDCCSHVGYCGRGYRYCQSPHCQFDYSDSCDSSIKPLGEDTINVPRPLIGNVTYEAEGIHECSVPGTLALTFDDGPYNYTSHVLDALAAYGAKATFFLTGNNLGKGQIDIEENGWPDIIRRMHADGHQIAAHSWGHLNLTSLNETEMVNQVQYMEMALRNILGFIPTYFRPPFVDCESDICRRILKKMGYHVVYQNVVNHDWQNDDVTKIENSKKLFRETMNYTNPRDVNYVFLLHDTHYQTSWNFTAYMLDYFKFFNFTRLVTVGECLGDPPENWYRPAGGAPNRSLLLHKSHGSNLQDSTLRYSTFLLIFAQVAAYMLL